MTTVAVILLTLCAVGVVKAGPVSEPDLMIDLNVPCTLHDGTEVPVGETVSPDPCTQCTCQFSGQRALCSTQACELLPCEDGQTLTFREGECCPVCATP